MYKDAIEMIQQLEKQIRLDTFEEVAQRFEKERYEGFATMVRRMKDEDFKPSVVLKISYEAALKAEEQVRKQFKNNPNFMGVEIRKENSKSLDFVVILYWSGSIEGLPSKIDDTTIVVKQLDKLDED